MVVSRSDSSQISSTHETLLHFGLKEEDFLARGTEAIVYDLGGETVLKIYSAAPGLVRRLTKLKRFYDSIDLSSLPFAVPSIQSVHEIGHNVGVVERKLKGTPLAKKTHHLQAMNAYLEAVVSLGEARLTTPFESYMLFDESGLSEIQEKDWHRFMYELIERKLKGGIVRELIQLIPKVEERVHLLLTTYRSRYAGRLSIVHGDLCPGNILIGEENKVTGIIDFGTFTMLGDPLFDIATSAAFYEMYGDESKTTRNILLAKARAHCADATTLYRYLLTYALLSADNYPELGKPISETGHYQWAVSILSDDNYWEEALLFEW